MRDLDVEGIEHMAVFALLDFKVLSRHISRLASDGVVYLFPRNVETMSKCEKTSRRS